MKTITRSKETGNYNSKTQRVYNSEKTFSIIPIEGWINYSEGNNIIFAAPKQTTLGVRYQDNIQIDADPVYNMELDGLWNSYVVDILPKSFENYKMKQMGISSINGKNAKWIEFTNTAHGQTFYNLVYMLVENNIMYCIMCITLERVYQTVEKDFKQMVNTFKIEVQRKDAKR